MPGETYVTCQKCMVEMARAVKRIADLELQVALLKKRKIPWRDGDPPADLEWDRVTWGDWK